MPIDPSDDAVVIATPETGIDTLSVLRSVPPDAVVESLDEARDIAIEMLT